jgi:hypothetical protein
MGYIDICNLMEKDDQVKFRMIYANLIFLTSYNF